MDLNISEDRLVCRGSSNHWKPYFLLHKIWCEKTLKNLRYIQEQVYPPEVSGGYFGLNSIRYIAACREIFGVNALRGKLHQLGSPNLQDIFIAGKLLWD